MDSEKKSGGAKTPRTAELEPWEAAARDILVTEMRSRKVTYKVLSRLLEGFDIDEMPGRINRKVHRGQFSAGFFLACLGALGVENLQVPQEEAESRVRTSELVRP
jgi:hypothetical protein